MRELHAVMDFGLASDLSRLKTQSLLFDTIHVVGLERYLAGQLALNQAVGKEKQVEIEEYEYLQSTGFLVNLLVEQADAEPAASLFIGFSELVDAAIQRGVVTLTSKGLHAVPVIGHYPSAKLIVELAQIALAALMHTRVESYPRPIVTEPHNAGIFSIALSAVPTPGADASWQDILDFKKEHRDKEWAFRRFLHDLATKKLTEAEISDEIEWSLNEYSKAMELHRIKASQSFVDVFVISPLEIVENLVKFNWSKIAKGILQIEKRKAELSEAEIKAPGRECAYVFEAKKRFGM